MHETYILDNFDFILTKYVHTAAKMYNVCHNMPIPLILSRKAFFNKHSLINITF